MAAVKSAAIYAMALLLVLAMAMDAQAQCLSALQLQPCQNAVTVANQTPTLECCEKVKEALAVADGPKCLCDAMTSATAKAFRVLQEEAVLLPSKCKKLMGLQYVEGYNCNGSNVP